MLLIARLSWIIPYSFLEKWSARASPTVSTFYVTVFLSLVLAACESFVGRHGRQLQGQMRLFRASVMGSRNDGPPETVPVQVWVPGPLVTLYRNLNHQSREWLSDFLQSKVVIA